MKNLRFVFRMLKRNPLLVFVNLPGLAIGLSAFLLLSVYLRHELSFDKHFQTKDRVMRLYSQVTENNYSANYAICLRDAFTEIPDKVPEIQSSAQIYRGWTVTLKSENQQFLSLDLLYSDPGFFDVFGLDLLYGDKTSALEGDKKVVLSASTAQKIFNKTDCVGEMVTISEEPFMVSGVLADLPKTTHFNFNLLASMQTIRPERFGGLELFTYFLINKNADIAEAGRKIASANDVIMKPWGDQFNLSVKSGTELLSDIHLYSKADFDLSAKANLTSIFIVAGIAFFILLIALVNYINLYVLHGEKRIAEIAARKSLGANRGVLSRLFYTETGIIGLFAFILAIVITIVAQPFFAQLMQRPIEVSDLLSPSGILLIVGFLIFLIFISGAYPSFFLSRINLVNGLKGKSDKINRKSKLSAASVLVQFSVTVFLISSLVVVYSQINYLKNIPLGFKMENVIGIDGFNRKASVNSRSIQNELAQLPFIESVGSSDHFMGQGCSGQGIRKYGNPAAMQSVNQYRVKPGFCKTMQLELVEGRYFSENEKDKKAIVLNEAAVKMLGLTNPIGQLVQMHEDPLEVIGVTKNFYYNGHPGEVVSPLAINNTGGGVNVYYLRMAGEFTSERQKQVAAIFNQYDPDYIFRHFQLSDTYQNKFGEEERVMKLVSSGSILAILISFIGLMALSILNVARRTKEIGIRKVMGSSETGVMFGLLRETLVLIVISMAIAFVGGYFVMQQWLNGFMDKIHLHAGYFLISGVIAIIVALMAVGWQSWKAATQNPIKALRYE